MKVKEIIKLMHAEFEAGDSLQELFERYKGGDISDKKLAYILGTFKDKTLISKYKIANNVLIAVMALVTIITAVSGYILGLDATPDYAIFWSVIAIIPFAFLFGFIKVSFQAYLAYLILSISQFPKLFSNFGAEPILDLAAIVITLFVIGLVWFLKVNLFPYMGFMGAKKNSDNEYLVTIKR